MGSTTCSTIGSRSPDRYSPLRGQGSVLEGKVRVRVTLRKLGCEGKARTIVVERVEPFGGRSKVIRVFLVPVASVIDGGSDKLVQSEGEVDMKR
jgi:hypothetical protein